MLGSSSGNKPAASGREALLGDAPQESAPPVMANDPGARGLASLQQTQQLAADTEALGMGILDQLGTQRNQLTNAIDRREEAHNTLSTSNRLIREMHRRATWMKVALCGIILTLFAGLMLIVYLHWFAGGSSPPPSSPAVLDAAGRALQSAGTPPPSPPPPDITIASQPGVGAGIIIILIVSLISGLICFFAIPLKIVARTAAFFVAFLLILITLLVLFLWPRALPPSVAPPPSGVITDISTVGRIFLVSMATVFAMCGCLGMLVMHVMAPQRAPRVVEPEPVELFREVKVVS